MGMFEDLEERKNVFTIGLADDLKEIFESIPSAPMKERDLAIVTGTKGKELIDDAMKKMTHEEFIQTCIMALDQAISRGDVDLHTYLKLKRLIETRQDDNINLAMKLLDAKTKRNVEV
jgi:hypothetical protein